MTPSDCPRTAFGASKKLMSIFLKYIYLGENDQVNVILRAHE
jgi:hypothetical protein